MQEFNKYRLIWITRNHIPTNKWVHQIEHPSPKGVICLGGCYFQEQLLATVAQDYGIQSIGIQQSWPPFMHTGFRRFPYRYFLTWGEELDKGWKKHNPLPEFLPMGSICKSEENDFQGNVGVETLNRIVSFINNIFEEK